MKNQIFHDILYEKSYYIKGVDEINTNFHKNLTVKFIEENGYDAEYVFKEFVNDILQIKCNNGHFVAHNFSFDSKILYNEIDNNKFAKIHGRKIAKEIFKKSLTLNNKFLKNNFKFYYKKIYLKYEKSPNFKNLCGISKFDSPEGFNAHFQLQKLKNNKKKLVTK